MKWDVEKYSRTCSAITNKGKELISILEEKNCQKVIDLGCGTGILTNDISEVVEKVVGIDSSEEMIKKAKESYPQLEFFVMDARDCIWEKYFDAAFSNAVFHFITDQESLLKSINKVLTKDGYLVCEFGAEGNIADILDVIEQCYNNRQREFVNRFFYPSKNEYTSLLEKHGFRVEEITIYAVTTPLVGDKGLRNWIEIAFSEEIASFNESLREEIFIEIEDALRTTHFVNDSWVIYNRRIRVVAQKRM